MSLLCCGKKRGDTPSVASSINANGKEVFMDDLVLNPNRIDARLEGRIAEWQSAINDYQAYEDICKEEFEEEFLPILEQLRTRPELFRDKKKYSTNVQTLANKLIKVNEMQKRLESSTNDDDRSTLTTKLKYYLCYSCLYHNNTRVSEQEAILRNTIQVSTNLSMSDKISAKWALRLNEINPTQGGSLQQQQPLSVSQQPEDNNKLIKIKPKWPDFLIDTYFDVIKINMYGRKMRRIIKLNQHYVVNITNGSEITKFYAYRDIRRVWLENGNTIVVVLKNGKQCVYMSHIAPHVLQQLTTRVQVRRSLDHTDFSESAFSLGYSPAVTAGIIKSISEENTLDSEAVVVLFANELKDRTVRSIRGDNGNYNAGRDHGNGSPDRNSRKKVSEVPLPSVPEESHHSKDTVTSSSSSSNNPLHQQQPTTTAVESSNSKKSVPSTTNTSTTAPPSTQPFTTPFSNAIKNAHIDNNSEYNRTDTINSEHTTSELSYHTAVDSPTTSTVQSSHAAAAAAIAESGPRLLNFSEGMPEYYVQSAIQTLIFDTTTSEGNTRKIFIDQFKSACIMNLTHTTTINNTTASSSASATGQTSRSSSSSTGRQHSGSKSSSGQTATLLEVRHFIDGMHEYILGNRGVSLALLYEREKQRCIAIHSAQASAPSTPHTTTDNNSNSSTTDTAPHSPHPLTSPGGRGITRSSSKRLGAQGVDKNKNHERNFQNPNTTAVVDSELTSRASLQFLKDNNMDLSMLDEKVVVFVSFIIFMVVEEALFLPLKADLINLLPSSAKQEEEQLLLEKMRLLSVRSQEQWGIPEELVSPLGWQSAVFELQGLEHNLTPSTQLHVLTRTVKAVYNEFKHVILPLLKSRGHSQSCIAADDLVPIFIYIFCRSGLKHPMRSRDLMWSLCHPDQLQGEGGYYLTVFESSIEFVLNEEVTRESFVYSYDSRNSLAPSAAEEASRQYITGLRRSTGGGASANSGNNPLWGVFSSSNSSRSSGSPYVDAGSGSYSGRVSSGGVFDISGDFIDTGMNSSGRQHSSSGNNSTFNPHERQHSNSSTRSGSFTDSRVTFSMRDSSMLHTLAQRLTLSNLLTRKPAPDNTTRESFN